MKIENLIKIIKTTKVLKILLPIVFIVLGIVGRVIIAKEGDPGGDPIDGDPVPY